MKKRQSIRKALIFISLLLFPITLNYLSPYVIVDGAFQGILSGSAILFISLFISSLLVGRSFCGWLCPVAGMQECTNALMNNKTVKNGAWNLIKWVIWVPWITLIVLAFLKAGGIQQINPFHLTDRIISIDEPIRYIIYYAVVGSIFLLAIIVGRRPFCHYGCWMSPPMIIGRWIRNRLRLPAVELTIEKSKCVQCNNCTKVCQMSLPVMGMVQTGSMQHHECILCGECADACPNGVIKYNIGTKG